MIDRPHLIHNLGYLHLDIKPDKIVISSQYHTLFGMNILRITDFGLSREYLMGMSDGKTYHCPQQESHLEHFEGNAEFCPIRQFDKVTPSRRDDIESMMYILIAFAKGMANIPWNNINRRKEGIPKERKLQWIQSKTRNTSIRVLCQGLPPVFERILRYAREELGYVHKPDYEWIRQRFEDAFTARRYSNDHMYDWDFLRRDEKRRYENNENFRVDLRTVELMELIEYEESRTGTPRAVVPEQEVQLPEKPMIPISPSTPAAPSLIPATTARTHVVRVAERLRD